MDMTELFTYRIIIFFIIVVRKKGKKEEKRRGKGKNYPSSERTPPDKQPEEDKVGAESRAGPDPFSDSWFGRDPVVLVS